MTKNTAKDLIVLMEHATTDLSWIAAGTYAGSYETDIEEVKAAERALAYLKEVISRVE